MRLPLEVLAERYRDNLFAAAFSVCKNPYDAEDIVQETFLQYHTADKQFESEQHIRAWLLRVAINRAKNVNLSFWRRKSVPLEEYAQTLAFEAQEESELFHAVMALPEKYRVVIHLYYYEDCSTAEIAELLRLKVNTVRVRLHRGRELLKENQEVWSND